ADAYLQRLIKGGHRVAVCEQTEDPAEAKKRGAKAVVQRDVIRLVTPGTLTEESLLEPKANNFLTSVFRSGNNEDASGHADYHVASIDISTGEFQISSTNPEELPGEMIRLSPGEVIASDNQAADPIIKSAVELVGSAFAPLPGSYFTSAGGEAALKEYFSVQIIDGLGEFSRPELSSIGGLLKYVELTQIGQRPILSSPVRPNSETVLRIDAATRINLELTKSLRGERTGSLLHAIDRTVTSAGTRLLSQRLSSPSTDIEEIRDRLKSVAYLKDEPELRSNLREDLKTIPDIRRAVSRLELGRGEPRDLGALRQALGSARSLHDRLSDFSKVMGTPDIVSGIIDSLNIVDSKLLEFLQNALVDELASPKKDGEFIRPGFEVELDKFRDLRDKSREILASLQKEYIELTGVKTLKVKHNNVIGYFIEVTATHSDAFFREPLNETFQHRQTLVNGVRFTTARLDEIQTEIVSAAENALSLELSIFENLRQDISRQASQIAEVAMAISEIDALAALAELAEEQNYAMPEVENGLSLVIHRGRHPVVEQALKSEKEGAFIENDCTLGGGNDDDGLDNGKKLTVVTGPNMAGKSTYLRQNALIVILAQMGSFVPAENARIGVVDRLFSRVGASDDLARGRSTFMVEMIETAGILNQATERSFVILDEIGRGTATFDGLSIAWATVEHLHEVIKCRALFATHYHELTALADNLQNASNATIEVKEWKDDIIFLHKVIKGAADRSYGVQVAKLAGLPLNVIHRAGEILQHLESSGEKKSAQSLVDDLPLFASATPVTISEENDETAELVDKLLAANPDEMSPRQALETLYECFAVAQKIKKHTLN
ncbi:MAG: DNA mismatch repair protein MutS, partial [Methyloligellaceae bacterium]